MQADDLLQHWGIMPAECELGMILLDTQAPERRWQGTAAAEEIGRLFPAGSWFVFAYRTLPLLKGVGDRLYGVVRDHRYFLFGQRTSVYEPLYPVCSSNACQGYFGTPHKILGG
jgi:predicted DCC family thiol-disulfide oxidoreductase YuxK